jgi:hypothetical protein
MFNKSTFIFSALILTSILLSSCNLPIRQIIPTQTVTPTSVTIKATSTPIPTPTPTPVPSLCDNLYFPNTVGDTWEYAGNNTAMGAYTRTDAISNSGDKSFSVQSSVAGATSTVDYSCTEAGLVSTNPIQQYVGPLLSSLGAQVDIKLLSNSGISLPAKINPGDTWQQIAEFDASSASYSTNGRLVFDYTAVGYENVTVPSGTYNALRVDTTIRIEISRFRILAGTYEMSSWMAPNVGIIKSQGTSHVSNVDFSDSLELTRFIAPQ